MHERASSYVEHGNEAQGQSTRQPDGTNGADGFGAQEPQPDSGGEPEERDGGDGQDSTFILLIILILLSQGKTDDKLLLALLYLLF